MWEFAGSLLGGALGIFGAKQEAKTAQGMNRAQRRWTARETRLAEKRADIRQKRGEQRANKALIAAERRAGQRQKNAEWRAAQYDRRSDQRDEAALIRAEKREKARWLKYSDPAFVRERAEAAGFNPLLFTGQASGYGGIGGSGPSGGISLPSGGGAAGGGYSGFTGSGVAGTPAFTSGTSSGYGMAGEMMANGFASLDAANARAEDLALKQSALQMENQRLQEVADNARFGPVERRPLAETTLGKLAQDYAANSQGATMDNPPKAKPQAYEGGITVYAPNGDKITITEGAARRLDVRPYETLESGVMTELVGEVIGEGGTMWNADVILDNMDYNPLSRGNTQQEGAGSVGDWLRPFGEFVFPDVDAKVTGQTGNNWDGKNNWWSRYQRELGLN